MEHASGVFGGGLGPAESQTALSGAGRVRAEQGGWFGRHNLGLLESVDQFSLQRNSQRPLDAPQGVALLRRDQAYGMAFAAHPRRSSDTVDVGFRLIGQIEVDNM